MFLSLAKPALHVRTKNVIMYCQRQRIVVKIKQINSKNNNNNNYYYRSCFLKIMYKNNVLCLLFFISTLYVFA